MGKYYDQLRADIKDAMRAKEKERLTVLRMIVASIKGTLVAGYFMHLLDEKFTIYWILALTMLFFAVLMLLPAATVSDHTGTSTEVAREHVEEAH